MLDELNKSFEKVMCDAAANEGLTEDKMIYIFEGLVNFAGSCIFSIVKDGDEMWAAKNFCELLFESLEHNIKAREKDIKNAH